MDTYPAAEVARRLGTSVPRIVRAVKRLGLEARGANGRLALTPTMTDRLRAELGVTPRVPGLSGTEVKVLAALSRAPLGLASARVVASHAALSPTAASRALRELETDGLVYREEAVIAAGRARRVELVHANRCAQRWLEIAPRLAEAQLPRRTRPARERRVPFRLRHLFWNTAPAQLEVSHGGPYVARRLLRTMDLEGLAWGARHLRPADWERAAKARGLSPSVRALARNLAGADTKVEFLHADELRPQRLLEEPATVAGLRAAGLRDLMATKLKVIGDGGQLRDYYDVKLIEERGKLTVEDGIALYLERYGLRAEDEQLQHLVRGLGYLDDVDEDESLPVGKAELAAWWHRRQALLVRHLTRGSL